MQWQTIEDAKAKDKWELHFLDKVQRSGYPLNRQQQNAKIK
jgi:hypothetical protein